MKNLHGPHRELFDEYFLSDIPVVSLGNPMKHIFLLKCVYISVCFILQWMSFRFHFRTETKEVPRLKLKIMKNKARIFAWWIEPIIFLLITQQNVHLCTAFTHFLQKVKFRNFLVISTHQSDVKYIKVGFITYIRL